MIPPANTPSKAMTRTHPDQQGLLLHQEAAQRIRLDIAAGVLRPGDQLPSLREMTKRYGFGMGTMRRAVEALCDEQILFAQQGRGIFVYSYQKGGYWNRFHRFQRMDGSLITHYDDELELFEIVRAAGEAAKVLGLTEDDLVVHWRRRMRFDERYSGIDEAWVPRDRFPNLTAEHFLYRPSGRSIYAIYEMSDGVLITSAVERIRSTVVTDALVPFYRMPSGTPLLQIRRTSLDALRRIVEFRLENTDGSAVQICSGVA